MLSSSAPSWSEPSKAFFTADHDTEVMPDPATTDVDGPSGRRHRRRGCDRPGAGRHRGSDGPGLVVMMLGADPDSDEPICGSAAWGLRPAGHGVSTVSAPA